MTAIFGIFNRDDKPVLPSDLKKMQMVICRTGTFNIWSDGPIGLGQVTASGSHYTHGQTSPVPSETFTFIAAGRLDNAAEVAELLRISYAERTSLSDYNIMQIAYGTWGDECSTRMYGDWSFAAWHPTEQRLVLSRDHHGNTALYYYLDHNVFAFATSRQALLTFNLTPITLDELYLAQYLTSWMDYNGGRTLHSPIKRLPPSNYLTITKHDSNLHRYWRLEDTPELHLRDRQDYVAAFREVFDEAVRCRLPATGPVGVSMSGGLDSGSVAVVAARHLKAEGRRLSAFTAVPQHCPPSYTVTRFNDEYPLAMATANLAGNIDLHPLTSATISPIAAIRNLLDLNCDPSHGACNLYWITDIRHTVKATGCSTLLTGVEGNCGISWAGSASSQPLSYRLACLTWWQVCGGAKQYIKSLVPTGLYTSLRIYRMEQRKWWRTTAINPEFAQRIGLLEHLLTEQVDLNTLSIQQQRCRGIMPGYSIAGAMASEAGSAYGLKILDPTADARVLAFSLSVPDHIFIDPQTGMDRWLIREAMKGYLPDEVRLNRKRGLQASDVVLRLRAFSDDVEVALDELAKGPAAEYVDVDYMRQVWQAILTEDTPYTFIKASNILCRGIMAGLFVNRFYA